MANTKLFVSFDNVSIRLREQVLFDGLCWDIFSDQHWAVIGPNGAGKSTLMKALCGSLPVVKGKIRYHFLQDNGSHNAQDYIAYVTFESQRMVLGDEAFYQERWNVGVNEDILPVSEFLSAQNTNRFHVIENRFDQAFEARWLKIIEQLELDALLKRNVVELSNGERRKVTIARALLKNPRLLILDNPFAGLDERFRGKLAANLENLMRGEMRVIIVGTNRDEIPAGVTHVLKVSLRGAVGAKAKTATKQSPPMPEKSALKTTFVKIAEQAWQTNSTVLVRMKNVNVAYNGTPILHHIDWTVRENERWALLGPNGAGKTTLLSLILADNPQAYANDIELFGRRRGTGESIWEIKRNIGWVAPELQLYYPRNATCFDVICSGWFDSVGLYQKCSPHQREVAQAWLQRFGLANHTETLFEQLSEGEQRLTLLARALVKNPALVVLDEPCQGLDAENRDRILDAIDSITHRQNTSMIYVTHRADEFPQSITHVLKLNEGRVVDQALKRN